MRFKRRPRQAYLQGSPCIFKKHLRDLILAKGRNPEKILKLIGGCFVNPSPNLITVQNSH